MLPEPLLKRLADGARHARPELGVSLGLETAQLEAQIEILSRAGLGLADVGPGYVALATPIRWIEAAAVRAALSPKSVAAIESFTLEFETGSTNRLLLESAPPPAARARVAIAEYQTAGRGRRERRWAMPPGAGLALSVAWRFAEMPPDLSALSLAVGAAVRRAIRTRTGLAVGLKWPNDLIVDGGKLGGILVELAALTDGGAYVVSGIGINIAAPPGFLENVSDMGPARDLAGAVALAELDRASLAAAVVDQLLELYREFAAQGFAPYRDEWLAAHVLDGLAITVHGSSAVARGTVRGVGDDGALIVEAAGGERVRILSGDVTVRVQP